MSSELTILAILGIALVIFRLIQILTAQSQVGLAMLVSARDTMPELKGVAARMQRAMDNSIAALAMFAPAVLILHAQGALTANSLLAAQVFLIARILYVPVYAAGIPWLRTVVWITGFAMTAWLYLMAL